MKNTFLRTLSFALILIMLLGMVPFACAESVPADVDELMELFDDRVSAPKEKSLLSETETMVVKSKYGKSIYVLAKAGGGKKLFTADEGAEVTVYARQSGYSLGIVKGTAVGGWMNSQYLVASASGSDTAEPTASADRKDAGTLVTLGRSYELGDGEKQDFVKAEECYKQAIELGSIEAMTCLARLYCKNDTGYITGSLFEGNMDPPLGESHAGKVEELLKTAAEKGDANALFMLAAIFYDEDIYSYSIYRPDMVYAGDYSWVSGYDELDIRKDVEEAGDTDLALEYYLKAYEKGSVDAAMRLDEIYYDALEEDGSEEALSWLKDRIKKNDSFAMWLYAYYSDDGEGSAEAEKYYALAEKTAVKQNDALTLALLVDLKYDTENEDSTDCFAMVKKAAEAGGIGPAITSLGYLLEYAEGDWTEELREIADVVLKNGNADELLDLGQILRMNDFFDSAVTLSMECCLAAAEKGSLGALLEMSCLIMDFGMTDPADWPEGVPERAFKVILDAAEKDIFPWMCDGSYTIVWMYENGFGTEKDMKKAEYWEGRIEKYWEEHEKAEND